jgi:hypothetical protein
MFMVGARLIAPLLFIHLFIHLRICGLIFFVSLCLRVFVFSILPLAALYIKHEDTKARSFN